MKEQTVPLKVLIAKPGLDGHDKGAKIIASLLRDAGAEVIYTGLRQSVHQVVRAAVQEDVHVIALSVLSGVHLEISRKLMDLLKAEGEEAIPVVIGGVISKKDVDELKKIGIAEVFPVGSTFKTILNYFALEAERQGTTINTDVWKVALP